MLFIITLIMIRTTEHAFKELIFVCWLWLFACPYDGHAVMSMCFSYVVIITEWMSTEYTPPLIHSHSWYYQRCGVVRVPYSCMALALRAPARTLHALWLKPRYPVRVSLWSRCSAWPGSMGLPHLAHGLPYAVGSSASLSLRCVCP